MSNAALLVTVGILGEYVAKIYEEGKGRPLYIVADTWNIGEKPAERRTIVCESEPVEKG
jgi:dolichol-phosphate mannosyltransferase